MRGSRVRERWGWGWGVRERCGSGATGFGEVGGREVGGKGGADGNRCDSRGVPSVTVRFRSVTRHHTASGP
ncbi:hypothetical protein AFM16_28425 [Streptomyces antibioticus]|uniref:Uncharacterized protein n=1 Tax=Streptomyces antibioticus TaxID=1890 RepID=A0ABX3LBH3_STRAT|nr:hypothetical protein AFM16_28425 [Streptomyces antibioticus]